MIGGPEADQRFGKSNGRAASDYPIAHGPRPPCPPENRTRVSRGDFL